MNRKCKICEHEVTTHTEHMGGRKKGAKQWEVSDEAVLFEKNVWFCNGCWKILTKEVFKRG